MAKVRLMIYKRYRDELEEIAAEINRLEDRRIIFLLAIGAPLPSNLLNKGDSHE